MARQWLELEIPGQAGDVRQRSLHILGDLVHPLDDLEVIDEGDVAHQDLRDGRDRGRIVSNRSLVNLIKKLGFHLEERLQRGMVTGGDGVDQPEKDLTLALVGQKILNGQTSIGLEPGRVVGEPLELGQDIITLALGDDYQTTVNLLAVLEGGEFDIGHDAKVVAAAFQSLVKVRMFLFVGVDNLARSQDDLEVDDSVGNESTFSGKPAEAMLGNCFEYQELKSYEYPPPRVRPASGGDHESAKDVLHNSLRQNRDILRTYHQHQCLDSGRQGTRCRRHPY